MVSFLFLREFGHCILFIGRTGASEMNGLSIISSFSDNNNNNNNNNNNSNDDDFISNTSTRCSSPTNNYSSYNVH